MQLASGSAFQVKTTSEGKLEKQNGGSSASSDTKKEMQQC